MPVTAASRTASDRGWPVTREAMEDLEARIARVRADLTVLAGQGLEEGIVRLPMAQAARRLEALEVVRTQMRLVDDGSCAIGRRATLRDEVGRTLTCELVFPGDGDQAGRISPDSALGASIIGAQAGDVVEVAAPVGRWSATVISIE